MRPLPINAINRSYDQACRKSNRMKGRWSMSQYTHLNMVRLFRPKSYSKFQVCHHCEFAHFECLNKIGDKQLSSLCSESTPKLMPKNICRKNCKVGFKCFTMCSYFEGINPKHMPTTILLCTAIDVKTSAACMTASASSDALQCQDALTTLI